MSPQASPIGPIVNPMCPRPPPHNPPYHPQGGLIGITTRAHIHKICQVLVPLRVSIQQPTAMVWTRQSLWAQWTPPQWMLWVEDLPVRGFGRMDKADWREWVLDALSDDIYELQKIESAILDIMDEEDEKRPWYGVGPRHSEVVLERRVMEEHWRMIVQQERAGGRPPEGSDVSAAQVEPAQGKPAQGSTINVSAAQVEPAQGEPAQGEKKKHRKKQKKKTNKIPGW